MEWFYFSCMLRFPSTNIKLLFTLVKQDSEVTNANGKHESSEETEPSDEVSQIFCMFTIADLFLCNDSIS